MYGGGDTTGGDAAAGEVACSNYSFEYSEVWFQNRHRVLLGRTCVGVLPE